MSGTYSSRTSSWQVVFLRELADIEQCAVKVKYIKVAVSVRDVWYVAVSSDRSIKKDEVPCSL